MRRLVAILLVLATPLCAQAGNRWRDSRGAPSPVYGGRPAYAPPPRGYAPPPREFRGPPPPYAVPPPPGPAFAPPQYRTQQQRAREEMRQGRRAPLPLVIERVRPRGAEYMDMREARDPTGRPLYVLRFRQHGRISDVAVDAETGMVQR